MGTRWHENAIIYEIQVALFRDSNSNGWGDLRGVTEKLEHVRDLGSDTIWLQPFYRSPYVDGGYDVVDHCDVSDRVGTLEDFDDLVARADELGIRVVIDLVVQHTSTEHPWFRRACRDRTSKYHDYYVWADEPEGSDIEQVFPGVEDGIWAWNEEAGRYYRHTFYSHEADLDVSNPDVIGEIERIMEFWLDRGIAGFRVDAVPYMSYQAGQREGRGGDGAWFLQHLHEVVRRKRPDGVLIAESDLDPDEYAGQFGAGDRMTHVLDFWVNNNLWLALARGEAEPIYRALRLQPTPPPGCQYANWLRNHDELDLERLSRAEREETMATFAPHPQMRAFGRGIRRRLAPMLVDPRQRQLAFFLLCALPGVPVVLYGDEIGMGDALELPDRASVRTPMQWSGEVNAGFSEVAEVEMPVPLIDEGAFRFAEVNVAMQDQEPDSLLNAVRRLFACRREHGPYLARDLLLVEVDAPGVLALRYRNEAGTSLCLANLAGERLDVRLPPEEVEDWDEVACDQPYDEPAKGDTVHLHGFGYRWLVRSA